MFLQIQNQNNFLNLHLTTCLSDWDMNEEIKLTTTTDQFYQDEKRNDHYLVHWHYARSCSRVSPEGDAAPQSRYDTEESQVQPSLWLMVNPTIACPIKYPKHVSSTPASISPTLECPPGPAVPSHSPVTYSHPPSPTEESFLASSSSEYLLTDDDDASSVDVPICRKTRLPKDRVRKLGLAQSKRLQRVLQESNNLKSGAWPRPPVNYCILIAMALNSSRAGSLNVQQIYNFTREHFPFFQTAPDGWKNTIRHNLCFSNSFTKTPQQVSSEGKRKSCLWHLTLDGRRRLRDEIQTLTGESFRVLKRSMNNPDMIQALFNL
ncbi:forkhead box protein R1 [Brienomyrus brachyistius]|uniref:forkhead box protein R1 n=1 Tax=Brienomyrus brachyistius TaxID=42636 RepID=UPI0020B33DFE|nr:forkhead box protein R1 [Brienomyrus brachyistius]